MVKAAAGDTNRPVACGPRLNRFPFFAAPFSNPSSLDERSR